MKLLGALFIICSIVFSISETEYFGNNFYPKSKAEIVCDLISTIIALAGWIIVYKNRIKHL